jgi:quercetin dioxygenase-like cupin family protein
METWDIATHAVEPHQPVVLRSDEETRVIAINLPEGDRLQEHQVHERAWVVVAAGDVEFEQGGESARGGPGFLVHFDPNERHEVRAVADSRLILLLSPWPGDGHPSSRETSQ